MPYVLAGLLMREDALALLHAKRGISYTFNGARLCLFA